MESQDNEKSKEEELSILSEVAIESGEIFIEGSSDFKVNYNFYSDGLSRSEVLNYSHLSKIYLTVSGNSYCFKIIRIKFQKSHQSYVLLNLSSSPSYKQLRCHLPEGTLEINGSSYNSVKYYAKRSQFLVGSFQVRPKYLFDNEVSLLVSGHLLSEPNLDSISSENGTLINLESSSLVEGNYVHSPILLSGSSIVYFGKIILEGSATVKGFYKFASDGSTGLEVSNLIGFYESTLILEIPTTTSEAKLQINHFVGLSGIIIGGTSNSLYEYVRRTSTFLKGTATAKAAYSYANDGDWPLSLGSGIFIENVLYKYVPSQCNIYFTSASLFVFRLKLETTGLVDIEINRIFKIILPFVSSGVSLEVNGGLVDYNLLLSYDPSQQQVLTTNSNLMGYIQQIGKSFLFDTTGSNQGQNIWGTDLYTLDSNLNLVAVHSGLFQVGEKGRLYAEILPPQAPYLGSTRNGIVSNNWNFNSYPSYKITKVSPYISGGYYETYKFEAYGEINVSGSSFGIIVLPFDSTIYLEIAPTESENSRPNKLYYDSIVSLSLDDLGFQILFYNSVEIRLQGQASINLTLEYSSNNNLIIDGSASCNKNKFQHEFNLSLSLETNEICFVPKMDPNYSVSSSWLLGGTGNYGSSSQCDFEIDFNSTYNLNNGEFHWYRVLCCCGGNEKIRLGDACSIGGLNTQNQKLYEATSTKENYSTSLRKVMSLEHEGTDSAEVYTKPTCHKIFEGTYPRCEPGHQSILSAVIARDMAEVCLALKNPKLGPPIDKFKLLSIKRNINPVCADDFFTFEEEDFCNCPECQDFCIDLDLSAEIEVPCNNLISVKTFVFKVFYHEPKINFSLSGSATVMYYWATGSGGMSITSPQNPILVSNYWSYEAKFAVELSSILFRNSNESNLLLTEPNLNFLSNEEGFSLAIDLLELEYQENNSNVTIDSLEYQENNYNLTINRLFRQGSGYFDLSGTSYFISPRWRYNQDAYFTIDSYFNSYPVLKYERPLTCSYFNFGSRFSYSLYYKYEASSGGLIELNGDVESLSSGYYFEPFGSMNISGLSSDIVSQYRSYEFVADFSLSSVFNKFGVCLNTYGSIQISGSAECIKYNVYKANGGIEIEGQVSDIVSPVHFYNPIGDFALDLDSYIDTNFTNFGLLVSEANFRSFISNVSLDYFSSNQSSISLDQGYIDVCGCRTRDVNLDLQHPMNSSSVFSKFLKRSNLEFDNNIVMRYNKNNNGWSYKNNIMGSGLDGENENWNIIFDLNCREDQNGNANMKFSFFVRKTNAITSQITSMTVDLPIDDICSNENVFSRILFNPIADLIFVNGKLNKSFTYTDKLGLFKNFTLPTKVDCSKARTKNIGQGRRDGFKDCNVVGPFPEFRINWTRDIKATNFINIQ